MSELLKRVKKEGNPLIHGDEVLFVWKGKKAPYLHLENHLFQAVKMKKAGKNIWTYQEKLPLDAYIEYNFALKKNDEARIVADPYNVNQFDTGMGHHNHYFSMPQCIHTPLIMKRDETPKGKVTKHKLKDSFLLPDMKRDLWLYEPTTREPVPLLVVLDGKDYQERGFITQIVDNMIADKRIQPIALAMIENAGLYRTMEYNQGDSVPMLLERTLLPFAQKKLNLLDIAEHKGAYGILGASMGGLMALYTGLRMPDVFGKVISQAGAFFKFGDSREALIHVLVDTLPKVPIKVWLDCGIYDFLFNDVQDMRQRLDAKGYDMIYTEHAGGHNYTCWRNMLPAALETMFGA